MNTLYRIIHLKAIRMPRSDSFLRNYKWAKICIFWQIFICQKNTLVHFVSHKHMFSCSYKFDFEFIWTWNQLLSPNMWLSICSYITWTHVSGQLGHVNICINCDGDDDDVKLDAQSMCCPDVKRIEWIIRMLSLNSCLFIFSPRCSFFYHYHVDPTRPLIEDESQWSEVSWTFSM